MIEKIVLDHLAARLPVPVYMEMPSEDPSRFVVLRKADSDRENLIDSAMFVADSYAESLLAAARLNEQVKLAMDNLAELDQVAASQRGGDYPLMDTQNKQYRYQAICTITHY